MKLKKTKKKILAAVASALCFAAMMSTSAYASGDVAGAVQSTWSTARSQVVSVVNNVVFPVIDVILAVLLFVKIGMLLHGLPQARSDRMDSGGYSVRLFDLYSDGSVVYLVNRLKRRICV